FDRGGGGGSGSGGAGGEARQPLHFQPLWQRRRAGSSGCGDGPAAGTNSPVPGRSWNRLPSGAPPAPGHEARDERAPQPEDQECLQSSGSAYQSPGSDGSVGGRFRRRAYGDDGGNPAGSGNPT